MTQTQSNIRGWQCHGQPISTPEGIHAEDYFAADGSYLGPDEDGVEPVFADRTVKGDTTMTQTQQTALPRLANGRDWSRTYAIFEHINGTARQVDERQARSGLAAVRMYQCEAAARGNSGPSWARYTAKLVR